MSGNMSMLLGAVSSVAAATDAFFNRVTLLLPGNGTNGAQNNTFLDSSSNNFTITRNGNTTQGTFSPFSQTGWSAYLSSVYGSSTFTSRTLFNGNSTIELWVYPNALSGQQTFVRGGGLNFGTNGAKLRIDDGVNAGSVFESTGNLTANTWNHVAVVRSSNTFTFFINGNSDSSNASISSFYTSNATDLNTGAFNSGGSNPFVGYLSNIRVSNTARTISLPTSAYSSDANTVWLIFQSNRFVDNSSNAYALSFVGTPSIQAFSPFAPTAAYSAATVGGSGYFDGTGDSLVTPSITIGTNAFCFECWLYPTVTQGNPGPGIFVATTSNGLQLSYYQTTGLGIAIKGIAWQITSTGLPIVGQWNHVAFVRSGTGTNQTSIFLNGTRVANGTVSTNYSAAAYSLSILDVDFSPFLGYVSGARLTNGSTPYDATQSTITIPTAPPTTSASNTALLLNFTNAGITDATAKNDLETVGNAQISTTQSKFGGSSMLFDGSGDYLVSPNIYVGDFLTGDFTIEYWFRCGTQGTSYVTQVGTLDSGSGANSWRFGTHLNTTAGVYFSYHNGSGFVDVTFTTTNYNDNAWHHAALTRSGSTVRAFIDGTQVGSNQTISTSFSARRVIVGAELATPTYYTGYIDDLRITKGYARYTSNFTAPTSAFALQ